MVKANQTIEPANDLVHVANEVKSRRCGIDHVFLRLAMVRILLPRPGHLDATDRGDILDECASRNLTVLLIKEGNIAQGESPKRRLGGQMIGGLLRVAQGLVFMVLGVFANAAVSYVKKRLNLYDD